MKEIGTVRQLIFLSITFLVTTCAAPKRISSDKNLFYELDKHYPLSEHTVIFRSTDTVIYLSSPKMLDSNKIYGELTRRATGVKKLVITSKEKGINVIELETDSTGRRTGKATVTNKRIKKVSLSKDLKGPDRRNIFDPRYSDRIALIVLGGILVVATFVTIIAAFNSLAGGFTVSYGCYVATMVYGNYDAPQVLVLRRFRDEKLAKNFFGRLFIVFYYSTSPYFVKVFKNNAFVNRKIRLVLDKFVNYLEEKQKKQDMLKAFK